MVWIFRKPIGFCIVYFLINLLISFLTIWLAGGAAQNNILETIVILIPYGTGILFTLLYSLFVDAHLSHTFRWKAAAYITILSMLFSLIFTAINVNSTTPIALFTNWRYLLGFAVTFITTYALITIGNWLASLIIKNRGHI
jgi:hypothetical protein